jgi:hypothetical protein
MSRFLEIALPLAERGFRVFPLIPEDKRPVKMSWGDHFDAATTDLASLEQWSREVPRANVGISPDENFCFLETDDDVALRGECTDLPPEVWDTTRVSARDNRCYYIFRQTMRSRKAGNMTVTREGKENLFEFKQHRVYVTGPGSIHPKTGKPYGVEWRTIPAMPDILLNRLCELDGVPKATDSHNMDAETTRQTALLDKFLETYEVATSGDWFPKGKQWYRPIVCPWESAHENSNQGTSTCIVYTEGGGYGFDCKHRCESKTWKEFRAEVQARFPDRKFSFAEPTAEVTIGSGQPAEQPKPVTDWRSHYHTLGEMENAPPPAFLIEGFLQLDAISALAAPVAQRKSLISLNAAHALCTGEPLFDYFKVSHQPTRVLYLCPEMGIRSFTDRVQKIGLMPYVGKTFFCRTMSAEGALELSALTLEELTGAVVIIDTAIRYLKGDENSSEHMRAFAAEIFRLMKDGTAAVLLLHHSAKGTKESPELTLENAMRGSGELGAFLASCWATRLQNPAEPYESPSFMVNVKQRDFESKPFEITSGPDCRLHIVETPGDHVKLSSKNVGTPGDVDGKEGEALQVIRDNQTLSLSKIVRLLDERGIKRSKSWVGNKRYDLLHAGVKTS